MQPDIRSDLEHYQGGWPEPVVPEGKAETMLFEVDPAQDVVLRSVEVYSDGRMERNNLALEERDGYPCVSLVHGPFMPTVREVPLERISAASFEELWLRARDKPWP